MSANSRSTPHWPFYRRPLQGWHYFPHIALLSTLSIPAFAQTSTPVPAAIDINTTVTTPISPGFSGVSTDLGLPIEYWDYRFNALASTIGFGWVRFPGGSTSDIYNWQTGEDEQSLVRGIPRQFRGRRRCDDHGSGGGKRRREAHRRRQSRQPAGRAADYLRQRIHRHGRLRRPTGGFRESQPDPGGGVGVVQRALPLFHFFRHGDRLSGRHETVSRRHQGGGSQRDRGRFRHRSGPRQEPQQIRGMSPSRRIANKYWDAITYHHYPPQSSGAFAQWMADESAVLATSTSAVVASQLSAIGPAGVQVSEHRVRSFDTQRFATGHRR